ncbi:MAG: hypothetical protein IJR59_04880 [Firmicutes bacterium]|nr:hypothetical protein [Bacillota bacterium]
MRNTALRRINPANGKNSYSYVRGSAAPAYTDDYGYRPKPKRRRVKKAKPQNEIYERYEEKVHPFVSYAIIGAVAFCIGALMVLSMNAATSSVKSEIKETEALTEKTRAVNEQLENMLSNAVDMEEVKKTAVTKLGMQNAAEYQMVTINVEKDSYSVQYDDQVADAQKKPFLEKIGLKK